MQLVHLTRYFVATAILAAFTASLPAALADQPPAPHPPIPVRFRLDEPAFVTLVIERTSPAAPDDAEKPSLPGKKLASDDAAKRSLRVKNLVSNTWYPAGEHTVWWDGLDESNAHPVVIPGESVLLPDQGIACVGR